MNPQVQVIYLLNLGLNLTDQRFFIFPNFFMFMYALNQTDIFN